ncbi:protein FAM13C isoform X2 [Xenopus laevis]|uniref:Protein FAM13C isoform X2 n=2 Tax=Xenopus laevis TaxID=8355 RepID=A0A8J1LBU0_XENLA|nr:protein FAM13C isoform X2 [Xenopus laevis]
MGTSSSFLGCKSLSAVQVKRTTNKVSPTATKVFGVSLVQCKVKDTDSIPLVIKDIVEHLSKFGLKHKGLFRICGSVQKVKVLKDKYDKGEKVTLEKEGDIDAIAGLLKVFLKELPEGVVPEHSHHFFIFAYKAHKDNPDQCTKQLKELIASLHRAHRNVLLYICTFLIRVASYSDMNSMTLENLSVVFGPSVFRVPFSKNVHEDQMLCNAILLHVLRNQERIAEGSLNPEVSGRHTPSIQNTQPISPTEEMPHNRNSFRSSSKNTFGLQENSFGSSSTAVTETEGESSSLHEDQTVCSKLRDENNKENYPERVPDLEDGASSSWDVPPHLDKKMFDGPTRHGVGILQTKQPKFKSHEGNQESENVIQCLAESWPTKGLASHDHPHHVPLRGAAEYPARNSPIMRAQQKEPAEPLQFVTENPFLKLQAPEPDLCPAFLPCQEEVVRAHCSKETPSPLAQCVPSDCANHTEPVSVHWDSQSDADHGTDDHRSFGTSRLLFHITDGDNPLLSPRCSIFSQSQRYNLDPESAPSPPSTQPFMMPRSSSRSNCEVSKEPLTVVQLTKQIQSLKRKIRKYEEKFELEKNYRPSHTDKTSNPEVLKWMNDLAKARKQLKELKLKISEGQSVARGLQSSKLEEVCVPSIGVEPAEASSAALCSVEDTVETVWNRLKEKRQLLNFPETFKGTKQERSLMKPLYDRYRIIKQLLSTASLIPTIHEEEDSDDDCSQRGNEYTLAAESDSAVDEAFVYYSAELEPTFASTLDDRPIRQPAFSMSNLHEASMPELLDQLRETRAHKKRLRKALREFEEHFLRQTGRSVQKEDRIPMAEDYCEYKQIKAKLRLLEVLISKQDVSKTI